MSKIVLAKKNTTDVSDMRDAFCESLLALAAEDDRIVLVDADLMGAMGTKPFLQKYPKRAIDCGVQEANMVGLACGLAVQGKIPFAHTFAVFCSRRANDQVFLSGAYNKANVKLVGSDPGITAAYNGGTHMAFEDMGIMRSIPTMTVVEPTDVVMLKNLMPKIAFTEGMFYMRLVRRDVIKVYDEGADFEIGKAAVLSRGSDVTIIASGYCVSEAVSAAQILAEQGVSAGVVNMFTWKPVDEEVILEAAAATGAIVTAENHNVINGLGSAVAEVLVRNKPVPVEMVGVRDEFGEVGPVSYLRERFGLTDRHITEAVKRVLARK